MATNGSSGSGPMPPAPPPPPPYYAGGQPTTATISALNLQTHTVVSGRVQPMAAPPPANGSATHATNGANVPNHPQALAPQALAPYAVPGRIPCGCGCGCNYGCNCGCGCAICSSAISSNPNPPLLMSGGHAACGSLGTTPSALSMRAGTSPFGCHNGTRATSPVNGCACGCSPCSCNTTRPVRTAKSRVVNSDKIAAITAQLGREPVTLRPFTQFRNDGFKTIGIQPIGIVPVLGPLSDIDPCSTPPTTVPGQDYYPAFNNFLGGGEVLTNVKLVSIFWGDYWSGSEGESVANYINSFLNTIVTSSLMDLLREYNAGGLGTHSDIIYVLGSLGAVIPSYLIRNMVTSLFPIWFSGNQICYIWSTYHRAWSW